MSTATRAACLSIISGAELAINESLQYLYETKQISDYAGRGAMSGIFSAGGFAGVMVLCTEFWYNEFPQSKYMPKAAKEGIQLLCVAAVPIVASVHEIVTKGSPKWYYSETDIASYFLSAAAAYTIAKLPSRHLVKQSTLEDKVDR